MKPVELDEAAKKWIDKRYLYCSNPDQYIEAFLAGASFERERLTVAVEAEKVRTLFYKTASEYNRAKIEKLRSVIEVMRGALKEIQQSGVHTNTGWGWLYQRSSDSLSQCDKMLQEVGNG